MAMLKGLSLKIVLILLGILLLSVGGYTYFHQKDKAEYLHYYSNILMQGREDLPIMAVWEDNGLEPLVRYAIWSDGQAVWFSSEESNDEKLVYKEARLSRKELDVLYDRLKAIKLEKYNKKVIYSKLCLAIDPPAVSRLNVEFRDIYFRAIFKGQMDQLNEQDKRFWDQVYDAGFEIISRQEGQTIEPHFKAPSFSGVDYMPWMAYENLGFNVIEEN